MRPLIEPLSFEFIDDACLALEDEGADTSDWPIGQAKSIGPAFEFHHTQRPQLPKNPHWLSLGQYQELFRAKKFGENWFYKSTVHLGFASAYNLVSNPDNLTDLSFRARAAAEHAGFAKNQANKLVAAMLELYSNIKEHSKSFKTGYVIFAGEPGVFEFIVADSGVGVMQTLKLNPDYSDLSDAGTALQLALQDGVSRHYGEPDRGRGFRPIFIGLANISQHIRFRSGDHAYEVRRRSDGTLPAYTSQKANLHGFFSYVKCQI